MKFGIIPINIGITGLEQALDIARLAETSGIESVWTAEHVIMPTRIDSRYPYSDSGEMPMDQTITFYDPLITLSAIAAATTTLKLGTGINILPQTNPLLLAKQTASLDSFSQGRLLLGLGLGWMREEFHAMGTPFENRGARFDDYLQAIRKVWSGDVVDHQSRFLDWQGFRSLPAPVNKSRLPVLIGGHSEKSFLRVARYADGWYPAVYSARELAPLLDKLRGACTEVGRNYEDIEITAVWANTGGLDELRRFQDLGVSRLTVPLSSLKADPLDAVKHLAGDIMAKL
ncbi:MAG: TIGR03619 family F420-dependent LLM class oxidoreductase [Bacteroidales bacterium]|nr:TIGR03619 family F420-dependent LLM class oxidoreductase [Bacteroidales bacterium]